MASKSRPHVDLVSVAPDGTDHQERIVETFDLEVVAAIDAALTLAAADPAGARQLLALIGGSR